MAISPVRYLGLTAMTYTDLITHFGTQVAIAEALGIAQPTVSGWKGSVPAKYQYQVEVITNGALRADDELRAKAAA